jgi:hypothetical protein
MLKAIVQEAAALASLALFIAMIAIWTQVLGEFVTMVLRRFTCHAPPCVWAQRRPTSSGVPFFAPVTQVPT